MTARIVAIAGTDTEVGKTTVGVGLARLLAARGRRVVAVKPVESGCGEVPSESEDGVLLARATGQEAPRAALVRLRAPLAPPVAADREGVALDPAAWTAAIRAIAERAEIVLVEGAGGLLSPLAWTASLRDLAVDLGAEAILVAADRLGCLNHALLTVEVLRDSGVPLLGCVLSAAARADASTGTNAEAQRRAAPGLRVAALPRLADPRDAERHLGPVASWLEGS